MQPVEVHVYCPLNITQQITIIVQITSNKNEYTLSEHIKTVSKVSIFCRGTIVIKYCLNPHVHGIHQSSTGCCWHPDVVAGIIMTSRSCWMLDAWCFSNFHLRMPHMGSIGFRSGDILGHSSPSAARQLSYWLCFCGCYVGKTVSEGRASSSASECHSTCWNPCFPQ